MPNIWAIVGSFSKYYKQPINEVLKMSYQNLIMYNAVIPSFSGDSKGDGRVINADDPKNRKLIEKELFG